MATILHVSSSSNLHASLTRKIGATVVKRIRDSDRDVSVIERDLVSTPLPHISPAVVGAMFSPTADADTLSLSDRLIEELMSAETIVIEAPMYNFGIPSALKAWIDHVVRAGKTFQFTASGPQGLLAGKKAFLIVSRGGEYRDGPMKSLEHQDSYLAAVLNFIGITDISISHIEGVAVSPERAAEAVTKANAQVEQLIH